MPWHPAPLTTQRDEDLKLPMIGKQPRALRGRHLCSVTSTTRTNEGMISAWSPISPQLQVIAAYQTITAF
jgi:hypothetical protein